MAGAAKRKPSVQVRYRVKSVGIKPGDLAWVSEETAESLVANRHAVVNKVEKSEKSKD
jgi:hypothetical protein